MHATSLSVFLLAMAISTCCGLLIIKLSRRHLAVVGDHSLDQPQKFHRRIVPRVGGFGVAVGFIAAALMVATRLSGSDARTFGMLCLASLLVLGIGLLEDVTKRITPRVRLLVATLAAAICLWGAGIEIIRSDIFVLDTLMGLAGFSVLLTLVAVAGVTNSINIIDGFNGLASMCVAIMMAALAYVAHDVGDTMVLGAALAMLGAIAGFFVWNYPRGLIFLGDGGAYFLGFMVAELGLALVQRNPSVSPMFPLLLCAYPIFETIFTMYRRKMVRGRPMGQPDATHLHSLIYRRLMRWAVGRQDAAALVQRNSMTSPHLWLLCSVSVVPAILWWDDSSALQWALLSFCAAYVGLYRSIVHFRTPKVLLRRRVPWPLSRTAG